MALHLWPFEGREGVQGPLTRSHVVTHILIQSFCNVLSCPVLRYFNILSCDNKFAVEITKPLLRKTQSFLLSVK